MKLGAVSDGIAIPPGLTTLGEGRRSMSGWD